MQICKLKFLARSLGPISYASSSCLFSLPTSISLLSIPMASLHCCWFREATEKMGRPGEGAFQAADSWWTLDDIYSGIQFFTESKSALPHRHCSDLPLDLVTLTASVKTASRAMPGKCCSGSAWWDFHWGFWGKKGDHRNESGLSYRKLERSGIDL